MNWLMRNAFPLLVSCCLASIPAISQVDIKNTSLLVDTNLLYLKEENWLKVSGTNGKISLVSKNGNSVSTHDNIYFNVRPTSLQSDTILIYTGKKLIWKKSFNIDTLGVSRIQIGNIDKDTASISEILANRGIRFIWKGTLYYSRIHIISFYTTFVGPNADKLPPNIYAEGNLFSNEQVAAIKTLSRNSKVIFERIIVINPDSRRRELEPYVMVIK